VERRVSRRELIAGTGKAGIAAAVLGLPPMLPALAGGRRRRIAIVGAGIAGLSAALTPADRGVRSTIYEASGRVGGRMHSNTSGYRGEFRGFMEDGSATRIQAARRILRLL
jgi:monoamine oxidase